jgi:hypothetical protein
MLLYLSELNLISLWSVFGLPLCPLQQDALCSEFRSMRVIRGDGRSVAYGTSRHFVAVVTQSLLDRSGHRTGLYEYTALVRASARACIHKSGVTSRKRTSPGD